MKPPAASSPVILCIVSELRKPERIAVIGRSDESGSVALIDRRLALRLGPLVVAVIGSVRDRRTRPDPNPIVGGCVDGEFVVAAAQVLQEGMAGGDPAK